MAARWGFTSAAHFRQAFRARYGQSPAGDPGAPRPVVTRRPARCRPDRRSATPAVRARHRAG
ncbi:hypothetical protein [Polymorphospora rubra]|uniref:hypothetical protein n=1 Tax=Polymorphospora rubra TaxID=338584 RepID=UPI0033D5A4E0